MLKDIINNLNYKSIVWLIIIHLIVVILIISKGIFLFPYFFLFSITYYIVYKYPFFTIIILMIILYPTVFQMTSLFNIDYSVISKGFRAEDIILILMGIVVLQKLFRKGSERNIIGIEKIIMLFFLLLIFNIIRNITQFGISALGEFRLSYLILVLPVYIALFFDFEELRKRLFLTIIFSSIIAILLSIPFIIALKGWEIGNTEYDRFLSSSITLGLIYGVIALFLSLKYNLVKIPQLIIFVIIISTFILVIVDSHRSAWLALVVALFSLYRLKEIKVNKIWKWNIWLLILILILIIYIIFKTLI